MSGYVRILEDNFCALHGQFIDHLRYTLFVTRNRIRTKNNRVSRFDRNFSVDGSSDTRQCCHRLSLASGRYKYDLFIGIVFHFFNADDNIVRCLYIPQFYCRIDNIYHASSFDDDFTSMFSRRVNDLLYTVYIRRKRSDDNTALFIFIKNRVKCLSNRSLGHCKSRFQYIGTVCHQCKHTFFAKFTKAGKVNAVAINRRIIHLEVPGVYDHTSRCVNGKSSRIRNTVVRTDKFNTEISKIDILSIRYYFSSRHTHEVVFF